MTKRLKTMNAELNPLGYAIRWNSEYKEFKVIDRLNAGNSYFTNDIDDAYRTAKAMAMNAGLKSLQGVN